MAGLAAYGPMIFLWIFTLVLIGAGLYMMWDEILHPAAGIASIIGVILIVVLISVFYLNSQTFQRNYREAVTNYDTDSVYREMYVVSRSGEIIYETEGSYDIEYKDNRLRWIDEDGYVQLIYLGDSATVVVNEIEKP